MPVNESVSVECLLEKGDNCLLLDVRPKLEFLMCKLPNFINVPLADLEKRVNLDTLKELLSCNQFHIGMYFTLPHNKWFFILFFYEGYVLCRRGNDSQRAIRLLKDIFPESNINFFNIQGGLYAYAEKIDPSFPLY